MIRAAGLAVAGLVLALIAGCGSAANHPAAAHPATLRVSSVDGCAKAIEAHPNASSWTTGPLASVCKGLDSGQQEQATAEAYAAGARGTISSPAQGSVTQCTARIVRDNADGTLTYRGAQAHDPRLPAPCRPLSSDQLLKALDRAVKESQ